MNSIRVKPAIAAPLPCEISPVSYQKIAAARRRPRANSSSEAETGKTALSGISIEIVFIFWSLQSRIDYSPSPFLPGQHAIHLALLIRPRRVQGRERLGQFPEPGVLANAVVDQEPL